VFLEEEKVAVTGRVMSIRVAGPKLMFIDLNGDDHKVQIMATAQNYEGNFDDIHESIRRGDIVGVHGVVGRSKTGELSIDQQKSKYFHIVYTCYLLSMRSLFISLAKTSDTDKDTRHDNEPKCQKNI